jgi:hypothetical protein
MSKLNQLRSPASFHHTTIGEKEKRQISEDKRGMKMLNKGVHSPDGDQNTFALWLTWEEYLKDKNLGSQSNYDDCPCM